MEQRTGRSDGAEPRATKGRTRRVPDGGVVREREGKLLFESSCSRVPVRGFLSEGSLESVRSRDPASGTERPPFPSPDPEYRQFPPSIRAEVVAKTPFVRSPPQTVVSNGQHVPARSTSSPTTPEGLGAEVTGGGLDAPREVTTFFSLGFCVNVCVWRQSVKFRTV